MEGVIIIPEDIITISSPLLSPQKAVTIETQLKIIVLLQNILTCTFQL